MPAHDAIRIETQDEAVFRLAADEAEERRVVGVVSPHPEVARTGRLRSPCVMSTIVSLKTVALPYVKPG